MSEKTGKIIEVTLRYNGNIVNFLYNVQDIEQYKTTDAYTIFSDRFGDRLQENIVIEEDRSYIQPDAAINLSITQESSSVQDFMMFTGNCLSLFDIPFKYTDNIYDLISNSYENKERELCYHTIVIINDFEKEEQFILLDYMTVANKENRQYNFLRK